MQVDLPGPLGLQEPQSSLGAQAAVDRSCATQRPQATVGAVPTSVATNAQTGEAVAAEEATVSAVRRPRNSAHLGRGHGQCTTDCLSDELCYINAAAQPLGRTHDTPPCPVHAWHGMPWRSAAPVPDEVRRLSMRRCRWRT